MTSSYTHKPNYALWETKVYAQHEFAKLPIEKQLQHLVAIACLAPSTHNTQPWRFKIDDAANSISVYLDRKSVLKESDPAGRQAVISLGCAIENIVIAAQAYGLPAKVAYTTLPDKLVMPIAANVNQPWLSCTARIMFNRPPGKLTKINPKLLDAIFTRKVTRAEFDTQKEIPKSLMREFTKVKMETGTELKILSRTSDRLKVAELQAQADGFVANSPKFAKELGDWILENNTKSFLGMPGSTFGLTDSTALRLHKGLLGKIQLEPEDMMKFSQGTKFLIERSGFIGLITAKADTCRSWLDSGRDLQRILLCLEANKIQASIHAGLTEVNLVRQIFASSFSTENRLLAVFRAGYAKRKTDLQWPHSPRLPLKKVLIS